MGQLRELLGRCDGLSGDPNIHVAVTAGNVRSLILDGARSSGFVQSTMRCRGPAVPLVGACDEPRIRRAWRCRPDLRRVSEESFPYVSEVLARLKGRCGQRPEVLLLGLGGGTMQSYLQKECPEARVEGYKQNGQGIGTTRCEREKSMVKNDVKRGK